jgi:protein TonB
MGDHPDAEALIARWARRLDRIVARAQIYPRDAQRTGQQGMVMLEVRIDASGRILSVEVRRSSGHPLLDEAAIASLQSLGSLPAPPGEVRWDGRPIQIPIHYRL